MTDQKELKPCPFCGSDDLTHRPDNEIHYDVGYVKCNDCLSSASMKAWNTRHQDEVVSAVVEALEGVCFHWDLLLNNIDCGPEFEARETARAALARLREEG